MHPSVLGYFARRLVEELISGLVDRVGVVVRRLHVPGGGVKGRVPYSSASFKEGEYPS